MRINYVIEIQKVLIKLDKEKAVKCYEIGEEHVRVISTVPLHLPCLELEKLMGKILVFFLPDY